MDSYFNIKQYGNLFIDKILFEASYPILFICKNAEEQLFICSCFLNNEEERRWLITGITPDVIIKLLNDEITLRDSFLTDDSVRVTAISDADGIRYVFNDQQDWDPENSICLPDADEYMDVEDGEFEEEIAYYRKFNNKDSFAYEIEFPKKIEMVRKYIKLLPALVRIKLRNMIL